MFMCIRKQVKLTGPVIRPFTNSDQHSFQKLLCHIDVPSFSWQNKEIKECPKYLLSFYQNWSSQYQRQLNVVQTKSKDVYIKPGNKYESGWVSSICKVI